LTILITYITKSSLVSTNLRHFAMEYERALAVADAVPVSASVSGRGYVVQQELEMPPQVDRWAGFTRQERALAANLGAALTPKYVPVTMDQRSNYAPVSIAPSAIVPTVIAAAPSEASRTAALRSAAAARQANSHIPATHSCIPDNCCCCFTFPPIVWFSFVCITTETGNNPIPYTAFNSVDCVLICLSIKTVTVSDQRVTRNSTSIPFCCCPKQGQKTQIDVIRDLTLPIYEDGYSEGRREPEGFFTHITQDVWYRAKEVEILRRYNVPMKLID
jgi:hypothetical protein